MKEVIFVCIYGTLWIVVSDNSEILQPHKKISEKKSQSWLWREKDNLVSMDQ